MMAPRNINNNSYRSIKSAKPSQNIASTAELNIENGLNSSSTQDEILRQCPKFITSTHELSFGKDGKPQIKFSGNFYA